MAMFDNTKAPRNLTSYTLMRGVTDFGNVAQFEPYESGYSFLKVVSIPKFLEVLSAESTQYQVLVDNYKRILEFEFKGLDGLDDITAETFEITDGISTLNMISKVQMQSAATVTMRFTEKSGTPITKLHKLFLTGIKDPKSEIKTYKGLIRSNKLDPGWENEIFTLLYMVTDNTATKIEDAFLLLAAQPTKSELSIFNSEKGQIEQKEVGAEFTCYPVTGELVYAKAKLVLDWMNSEDNPDQLITEFDKFNFTGIDKVTAK